MGTQADAGTFQARISNCMRSKRGGESLSFCYTSMESSGLRHEQTLRGSGDDQ